MTIYAHTDLAKLLPAYINIRKVGENMVQVTVRSSECMGKNETASIDITVEELKKMSDQLNEFFK